MFGTDWLLIAALVLVGPQSPQSVTANSDSAATRAARVASLRARAKEQIERERRIYSEFQRRDIEERYRSAHRDDLPIFLRADAEPILLDLIATYPNSNRSGCAVLKLANLASGEKREAYLNEAIARHGDAWCDSGVQVGALARAQLAVRYVALGKAAEAERLAQELVIMFPGAIDESGAPLDDVPEGVRLLGRK